MVVRYCRPHPQMEKRALPALPIAGNYRWLNGYRVVQLKIIVGLNSEGRVRDKGRLDWAAVVETWLGEG